MQECSPWQRIGTGIATRRARQADLIRIGTQFRLGQFAPNRKSSLFYKTLNGARVGDIFMSLIHTAELAGVDVFDYLVALSRHASEAAERPGQWMPWNYRERLASLSRGPPG